jgi:hypothetical protein
MATPQVLARVETLAWVAIYAGMFTVILGIVFGQVHRATGWSLGVLGAVAVATGIVLIVVRSRMTESPTAGAQSDSAGKKP